MALFILLLKLFLYQKKKLLGKLKINFGVIEFVILKKSQLLLLQVLIILKFMIAKI